MSESGEFESARLGTAGDVEVCAGIAERHAAGLGDQRGADLLLRTEAGLGPVLDRLSAAVEDDDKRLIVGTFDGVVFGYGLASIRRLEDGSKLGHLEHFIVDEDAREVAIGESIMNLAVEELKSAGCFGVDSQALPGDRETKNFFESFGQKARMLVVHRHFE